MGGYTKMVANMLEDIEIRLGVDYLSEQGRVWQDC